MQSKSRHPSMPARHSGCLSSWGHTPRRCLTLHVASAAACLVFYHPFHLSSLSSGSPKPGYEPGRLPPDIRPSAWTREAGVHPSPRRSNQNAPSLPWHSQLLIKVPATARRCSKASGLGCTLKGVCHPWPAHESLPQKFKDIDVLCPHHPWTITSRRLGWP